MRRKLVQQGKTTLMVSLPKPWLKAAGLTKGDEVDVTADAEGIRITADDKTIARDTRIVLADESEAYVRTLVTNTYRKGYDRIEVSYSNQKQFLALQRVIRTRLIGFEITRSGSQMCTVENVTEPSHEQFDALSKKLLLNVRMLLEQTRLLAEGKALDEPEEAIQERIQRFDNFCRRVLSRRASDETALFTWSFLGLIVHAAREVHALHKMGDGPYPSIMPFIQDAIHLLDLLTQPYVNGRFEGEIEKIHRINRSVEEMGRTALRADSQDVVAVHLMLGAIRRLYQANSPLVGMLS